MNNVAKELETTAEIIEVTEPRTIQTHYQDNSIESFISAAIAQQLPIETIKEFLVMRKELKADQAKESFTIAMAQFQKDCPVIAKTKEVKNKEGKVTYRYALLDSIIIQVKDVLGENKLSYDFSEARNKEDGTMTVTCTITHSLGHTKSSSFTVEIGTEAYMTDVQKHGARNTFAKRYAFINVLGIVTGDEDTDAKEILSPEDKKQAAKEELQNRDVSMELSVISSCKDLESLKRIWIGLSPAQRENEKLIEVKETMKIKLEQDAAEEGEQKEEAGNEVSDKKS